MPPSLPEQKTPWLNRNWKWLVPSGCLVALLLFAAFAGAIFMMVSGMIKSSGAYSGALERARSNGAVVAALGKPIEEGWFLSGNINTSGPSGNADLSIPISGPRAKGTLYIIATKRAGQWEFETLQCELKESGQRIDLLANP